MYSIDTIINFIPNYRNFDVSDYKYILENYGIKHDISSSLIQPNNIKSIREYLSEELMEACEYLNEKNNENEECRGVVIHSQRCHNCDTISFCSDCETCKRCEKADYCENSTDLLKCLCVKDSSNCRKCTTIKNCYKCKKSKYLNRCSECKDCKDCLNCHGCKLCRGCINCVDCENCIGCFNCVGLRNTCDRNFGKLFK